MLGCIVRNPVNWAFVRPLKVLATLGNRFFAGVDEENTVKKHCRISFQWMKKRS